MHLNLSFFVALLPLASSFVHPGLLVTDSDITRAQQKIKANADPWTTSWNVLTRLRFSDASYAPSPASVVYRSDWDGNAANAENLWHDVAAAFNLALRWKISSNTTFADTASNILHAWATKLTALGGGDDKYLTAGLQGYQLANAAELLRDYEPFATRVLPSVIDMANTIFIPMHYKWLWHEEPSQHNVLHFFANWELCNVASAMAMGVLTDNQTVWDFAVEYFKQGEGTGSIHNAITDIVEEPGTGAPLGQGQEAGRDQGHSALDVQLLAVVGQQAWNQGEDLFALNDSRILRGIEYWARYNLGHDVPFVPYSNGIVSFTEISSASRGAMRPTWELLYNHYVTIKGMDAPWTTKFLNESLNYYGGAEGGAGSWGEGSGHYDGLGWGSLLHRLDKEDVAAQGSGANTLIASAPSGKATSKLPQSTPDTSPAVSSGGKSTSASTSVASSTPTPQSSPSTPSPGTSTPASTPDPQPTPRPTEAGQKPGHRGHRHHHHGHKHGGCHAHS
ncbi:uncharacterized protein NFIA_063780 [Aspergillus fischeri NRRL 181]|uniref:Alginate lyase domain-containing protein n=1 Tax=Neosartorya fischeri (strain ATCC 1020 / DSM 3700 / CBS 544.65 / FGSC A1164 / JCM 1740 / NRRL 181 / WB 181) TaxID=331117 RepID=A1D673_NEOFI|nr:uncharacterized protein NFIA_063780 [Aspergillus fischeri NRRL 181]EAW21217.1 hypothetical protein NFIA_063780 [Aspergillus fischeri NRRL 181]